jgi:hypothetical protein
MDKPGEFLRLARGYPVVVHDVKRITCLPHMQARQCAPRAANCIKSTVLAVMQHVEIFKCLFDELFRTFERFSGDVLKSEPAKRQCHAATHARAMHIDQLKRAATEIAYNAIGLVDTGHDAERGEIRFALA